MSDRHRGILYIATGAAHTAAARASAASVRRSNPGLPIAIRTDIAEPGDAFDLVLPVADAHFRSKIDYMQRTPFAETLYLDSDTRVLSDLTQLFRILERFDIAMAHVARFWARGYQKQWRTEVPTSFPQVNTGVILYRNAPHVIDFLGGWRKAYEGAAFKGDDQTPMREMLWLSDLRLAILPSIYNARRYTWADRLLSGRPAPVILHTNLFHPTKSGSGLRRRLKSFLVPPVYPK